MSNCYKVAFCGAPSTRKSTVCAAVEAALKQQGINADTSREYAREYINHIGLPRELFEQCMINEAQTQRDEAISKVARVLLTDSPPMAPYVYGYRMALRVPRTKAVGMFVSNMHDSCLERTLWFDKIFVLPPRAVVLDGTRTETDEQALQIHKAIVGFLDLHSIPYELVEGEDQHEHCIKVILDALIPGDRLVYPSIVKDNLQ